MALDFYRRRLPHIRAQGLLYFVTWRLSAGLADLSAQERDLVASSLRHFDGSRYRLHAFVVMNDHVHVIVDPRPDFPLEAILHSWKSFSAKQIGALRGQAGMFWQDEYFDRAIRDDVEYEQKRDYILNNAFKRWPGIETYRWHWALGADGG
jgi:REP element-mobilizing transposase RayT